MNFINAAYAALRLVVSAIAGFIPAMLRDLGTIGAALGGGSARPSSQAAMRAALRPAAFVVVVLLVYPALRNVYVMEFIDNPRIAHENAVKAAADANKAQAETATAMLKACVGTTPFNVLLNNPTACDIAPYHIEGSAAAEPANHPAPLATATDPIRAIVGTWRSDNRDECTSLAKVVVTSDGGNLDFAWYYGRNEPLLSVEQINEVTDKTIYTTVKTAGNAADVGQKKVYGILPNSFIEYYLPSPSNRWREVKRC